MSKISDLESFAINKGKTFYIYMYIVNMNGGDSQKGPPLKKALYPQKCTN